MPGYPMPNMWTFLPSITFALKNNIYSIHIQWYTKGPGRIQKWPVPESLVGSIMMLRKNFGHGTKWLHRCSSWVVDLHEKTWRQHFDSFGVYILNAKEPYGLGARSKSKGTVCPGRSQVPFRYCHVERNPNPNTKAWRNILYKEREAAPNNSL